MSSSDLGLNIADNSQNDTLSSIWSGLVAVTPTTFLWDSSSYSSSVVAEGNFSFNERGLDVVNSTEEVLPPELSVMSSSARISVLIYCVIWLIGSGGNCSVFVSCYREYKKQRSRITLLILHLSIADLIVCFCLIPIEIAWRITIQWYGGLLLCKLCQFIRAFGLYLSSMVLISLSCDRFFAILFPLKFAGGKHRVKVMLTMAWIASGIFAAPQAIFFNVESHPQYPSFRQCVSSSFLSKPEDVKLYSIFSVSAMYFAPLFVIIFTYTAILLKIIRKSRQHTRSTTVETTTTVHDYPNNSSLNVTSKSTPDLHIVYNQTPNSPSPGIKRRRFDFSRATIERSTGSRRFRRSMRGKTNLLEVPAGGESSSSTLTGSPNFSGNRIQLDDGSIGSGQHKDAASNGGGKTQLVLRMSTNASSNITKAKSRTLRLTIVIVLVFVLCWTPYVVMTLWYMFDWETAQKVDPRLQDALFMMAVANSCVNPLIYGSFTKNCCGLTKRLERRRTRRSAKPTTIKEALESQS